MNIADTVLVCPRNDEESLQILKIAQTINLPTLVSSQPHGARLEKEVDLLERIQQVNSQVQNVVIVEIPGPKQEEVLEEAGYTVHIIDHHRYDDLDRTHEKSSLEQFLGLFSIDANRLTSLGFDPMFVFGVGAIDRGFLWELKRVEPDPEKRRRIRAYYRSLTMELGPERRAREEEVAKAAWAQRREERGVIIVESDVSDVSFRDALSFEIADTFSNPRPVLIRQGQRRMYVQDTDAARRLHDAFGGFLFGQERCWGILAQSDRPLPGIDEVMGVVLQ